jgi:hypothetical protein
MNLYQPLVGFSALVVGALGIAVAIPQQATGAILLQDDFTGGSINPALWSIATPFSGSSVTLNANRVRFARRGFLNTVADFDPTVQPIQITGRWEFGDITDFMQISTRSQGLPFGTFGENRNGLELRVDVGGAARIHQWSNGSFTELFVTPISVQVGDIFDFTIIDTGTNFEFTMTEVGGEGATASHSLANSFDTGFNRVTVHNREASTSVSYLHNITISSIPAPGVVVLMLGGLGLGARRRRG